MKNTHPTVKPVSLMAYLCRLITPPNGIILDPFMGSGSTGIASQIEGFRFVGMEMDSDYFKISEARINSYEEYKKFIKK
jgi:site-specific DNA-methyltransferase (adenine-specific)